MVYVRKKGPWGPFSKRWTNSYPSMDKYLPAQKNVSWNYLSIPKLHKGNRWSLGMDKYFHPTL